jgi:hypothetical protein
MARIHVRDPAVGARVLRGDERVTFLAVAVPSED